MGAWHIETHEVNITLTNAAGIFQTPVIAVDRPGSFIAGMILPSEFTTSDNINAIGNMTLAAANPSVQLAVGVTIVEFFVRIMKQLGTDGDVNLHFLVTMFIRDRT